MVLLILTNLALLGSAGWRSASRSAALQGILLGILPLMSADEVVGFRHSCWPAADVRQGYSVRLLKRTLEDADVHREVEPFIGYSLSLLAGLLLLALSLWLDPACRCRRPPILLVVPVAIFMMLAGLFLIVSRKKALTQVIGTWWWKTASAVRRGHHARSPVFGGNRRAARRFVAVFIMGIILFHQPRIRSYRHGPVN